MFYGQCWKCGERWELGTASACKCPDEEPVKFAFRENNDSTEVLRVTPEGEFIWHEDADRMIEEGDFSQSPALPHILKVLRKQRHEQEPVAWADHGVVNWIADKQFKHSALLYEAPQRKPLSDEQIGEIGRKYEKFDNQGNEFFARWGFARAIEAAHGIKE